MDAEGENGLVATGRGRGWDQLKEWHRHVYTTACEMDGWWEAAAKHRELSSVLCDGLAGWDEGVGGRPAREGLHISLIHFVMRQKLTRHCKAIILQQHFFLTHFR